RSCQNNDLPHANIDDVSVQIDVIYSRSNSLGLHGSRHEATNRDRRSRCLKLYLASPCATRRGTPRAARQTTAPPPCWMTVGARRSVPRPLVLGTTDRGRVLPTPRSSNP